jgi:hypothetical protein
MKTLIITLLVFCTAILGSPSAWAQAQAAAASQGSPPAPVADKAAPASPEEQAQLAQLSAQQDPGLLKQAAGERVVVVEGGGGWRRGPRYGYGWGPGAIILTAVLLVTLIVVASQPTYYRR